MNRIILLTLYMSDTVSQSCLSSIVRLFHDSNLFFETIDYSITYLSSNYSYKSLNRTGRFSEKRISDYYRCLEDLKSVMYSSIEFNKRSHRNDFKTLDISFSILYSAGDSFNTLTLAISEDYSSIIDFKELSINSINLLLKDNCGLFYGTTHCMRASKLPLLFVNGVTNNNLDVNEIVSIEHFKKHSKDIFSKIWKISWGNLINSKQFVEDKTPVILSGKRFLNTIEFSNSLVWFNFDCTITDFQKCSSHNLNELLTYFKDKLL
ncbi:MAG: hypothetical protein IKH89_00280 [Bacteroidales bacterium]|nr:hypothetical protein [Bacteroidales bacterium]